MDLLDLAKNASFSQSPLFYKPLSTVDTSTSHFARLLVSGNSSCKYARCKTTPFPDILTNKSQRGCSNCMICKSIEGSKQNLSQLSVETNNNQKEESVAIPPADIKTPLPYLVVEAEGVVCAIDEHSYYVWTGNCDEESTFSRQVLDINLLLGQWIAFTVKQYRDETYEVVSLNSIAPKFPTQVILGAVIVDCLVHLPAKIDTKNCLTVKSEISENVSVGRNQSYLNEQAGGQEKSVQMKLLYRFYEGEICGFWEIRHNLDSEKNTNSAETININKHVGQMPQTGLNLLPIGMSEKADNSGETIDLKHDQMPSSSMDKAKVESLPDVTLKVSRGVVCAIRKDFSLVYSRQFEMEVKLSHTIGFVPLGQWIEFVTHEYQAGLFEIITYVEVKPCFPTILLSNAILVKCSVCFPFKIDASRCQTLISDVSRQVLLGKAQGMWQYEGRIADALLRYNNSGDKIFNHWEIEYIFPEKYAVQKTLDF